MKSRLLNLSAAILLAGAALAAPLTAAADADTCGGHWIQTLGGPHAILRLPLADQADLQKRLPALESSIRTVVTGDPSLGPVVADALIAQIRNGSGITERAMRRDEAIHWMAYQPHPGEIATISPACLRLMHGYDSFEIAVEVVDTAPVAPAANCVISATRSCSEENATFTVDISGSSPGANLTMAWEGQAAMPLSGQGEVRTVEDPQPRDSAAIFTVRAQSPPAPTRVARVFRFLIPKTCGNLAYLGEGSSRTLSAEGSPTTCEKSVRAERCGMAGAPSPVGTPAGTPVGTSGGASGEPSVGTSVGTSGEPPVALAPRCEDSWIARPFVFGFFPSGNKVERSIEINGVPAHESFELDDGYGLGFSLERRIGPVLGIEGSALLGRGDSKYRLNTGAVAGEDTHRTTFYALTAGPNFHLLGCGGADLYLGPFLGYGGFGDPNYWVADHRFVANFSGHFIWGGQIGLDLPFRANGPWAFHGGLRYMVMDQSTDAGSIKIDPWIAEIGLSYRF